MKATEKRELRENSNDIVETQLPALEGASVSGKRKLTEAERRFEETQRRRVSLLYISSMERNIL